MAATRFPARTWARPFGSKRVTVPSPAIESVIAGYLDHLSIERGVSRNTLAAYTRDLSRYNSYLQGRGITELRDVTPTHIAEFATYLALGDEQHVALSRSSISRISSAIRGLHTFGLAEGTVDSDVTAQFSPHVPARPLPKALPLADVLAILGAPDPTTAVGMRDRALLEFLYGTGSRVTEAVSIRLEDIDIANRQVVLTGKGSKQRIVPMGSHAIAALEAYLVRARPQFSSRKSRPVREVFLNQRGGPLTRQSAWNIIRAAAARADVTHGVSPHVLRHSFATHLMDGGADVRVVQELLGHSSVTTTQIYTMVTVERLREVYLTSHPRALA